MDRINLKKSRYRLLPMRIKLIFWVLTIPLCALTLVCWGLRPFGLAESEDWGAVGTVFWLLSMVSYGWYETRCYDWYKINNLQ